MNRRTFCLQLAAAAAYAASVQAKSEGATVSSFADEVYSDDAYALWSLLIPTVQSQSNRGRGCMIAHTSAVADTLPSLQRGSPRPAIQRQIEATSNPNLRYVTEVPAEFQVAFAEAIAEAKSRQAETVVIERRLTLPMHYRILSQDQINAYLALSPPVVPAGWKFDRKVAREFKGWNELSFISLPYFDSSHKLALIWANTLSGCSSIGWHFFSRSESGWARQNWNSLVYSLCA